MVKSDGIKAKAQSGKDTAQSGRNRVCNKGKGGETGSGGKKQTDKRSGYG